MDPAKGSPDIHVGSQRNFIEFLPTIILIRRRAPKTKYS
jgi:hypothetical protein